MEILFVTTELSPFVRASGLADVAAALPKTLKALGHRVTVVLPRSPAFEEAGLLLARRLTPLPVRVGDRAFDVTVYDGRLSSQVDLVLLDLPGHFEPAMGREDGAKHPENAMYFAVFSRAVAELAAQRQQSANPFDVVHLTDWTSALAARFLKDLGVAAPSLLTVTDLRVQGRFPTEVLESLAMGGADARASSLLASGILAVDAVTMSSPGYDAALRKETDGAAIADLLADKPRVTAIAPGVDYALWNPATDSHLAARYDAEDTANKVRCRGAVRAELGLAVDGDAPFVLHLGPLDSRHGSDLVAAVVARILRGSDAQVVVAGHGEPEIEAAFAALATQYEGRAVFVRAPSDALIHRLFSAADIVLSPHRAPTNDFAHLRAQRYGALPVASRAGILADTIVDCDANLSTGTGFLFDDADEESLYGSVSRAVAAHASPSWGVVRRRVMKLDRSWERTARQYEQAYRSISTS